MKDLVEYIVKQIVNNSDQVVVDEIQEEGQVRLILTVDDADMGIVIGKSGQTIKAIRKILSIRGIADQTRIYLELKEPEKTPEQSPVEA